ncbi:hypothetical protein ACN4EG_19665 [Alkalinema pantanalense CENA528]
MPEQTALRGDVPRSGWLRYDDRSAPRIHRTDVNNEVSSDTHPGYKILGFDTPRSKETEILGSTS